MRTESRTPDVVRMVVGISGATGIIYGIRILKMLRELGVETHVVVTRPGDMTRVYESEWSPEQLRDMAHRVYSPNDVGAAIASGSFLTAGMIVAPCSIRTLSEIAYGATSNLVSRAADVCLKEKRRLVLLVRETPLHAGHLKSMLAATEAGAIIAPPVPAFYVRPKTIDDVVDHTAGRVLDLFGLHHPVMKRWEGHQPVDIRRGRE